MRRRHKDGSYKVTFRDGSSEARVSVQRIALTVDTLRALADWHTCTSTTDAYSEEHLDAVYRATTEDAGDGLHHHHELPLSSPDCSFRMLASTDNVHSFVSEDMPLDADKDLAHEYEEDFVAQGSEDLNSWIESEDGEFERGRLSSIDSVLSADGNSAVPYRSSKSFLLSPREKDFSYIVATFQQAPLGLRLSSSRSGNTGGLMSGNSLSSYSYTLHADQQAEVTKVVSGGRAELVGVQLGDALMQVEGRPVRDYTEAMAALQGCAYPLTLQFRRNCGTHASNSISASTHSSMVLCV